MTVRPLTTPRVRRREMLRGAGIAAIGAGGIALVGCGDDDSSSKSTAVPSAAPSRGASPGGSSSPAAGASPAAAKPKTGGTLHIALAGDPSNLDSYVGASSVPTEQVISFTNSRLVRYGAGPGIDAGLYKAEPDVAETVTASADGLTYTVKLRANAKWHPPVSRPVNADDIVFSWKRFTGQISGFPASARVGELTGWVDSVERVDDLTVVFHLNQTRGDFLTSESKWIHLMPNEAGTLYDPAKKMVGTGPWIFDSYTPGSVIKWHRNPDWHLGPAPYFDALEMAIVPDYATRLNQFLAGNLDAVDITGNDLGHAQDALKGVQVLVRAAALPASKLSFENEKRAPTAPWRDPRVRQAISMALDRNAMLEAGYNLSAVEKLGFKVSRAWNNEESAFDRPYWLDPEGKFVSKAGNPAITADNKKAFAFSPADAKKLLEAAGFGGGFSVRIHTTTNRYGQAFDTMTELTQAYLTQIGLKAELVAEDYSSVYKPITTVKGDFDGLAHVPRSAGVRAQFALHYLPGGSGNTSQTNDPVLNDRINKMLANHDPEAVRTEILSLQNYLNDKMYNIPMQLGAAGDFFAYGPKVRGIEYQVNGQDQGNETWPFFWKDA